MVARCIMSSTRKAFVYVWTSVTQTQCQAISQNRAKYQGVLRTGIYVYELHHGQVCASALAIDARMRRASMPINVDCSKRSSDTQVSANVVSSNLVFVAVSRLWCELRFVSTRAIWLSQSGDLRRSTVPLIAGLW